jgi:peptide/nickel transport system substrate-binding protein
VLRAALTLGACLATLLPLTGCSKRKAPEHEPGVAVVVPSTRATWIRNFNPFFESQARWPAAAGIYEPLVIFNRATGEFVPWLATAWRWEDDNRTMVLTIREGVKWSDGEPFTPRDVVFTFELMKKFPALDQSGAWNRLEGVSAEGNEVRFAFKRPFVLPALYLLGERPIVAEHVWRNVDDPVKFSDPEPVGTGPFTRVLSFKTQVYELGKNPNYWQPGKPKLDVIRVPAFAGNEQQALSIIRGEVDWSAAFLPAIDRIFVAKDPEHHGYHFPSLEGTVMLYPNTQRPPLDDVRVRKAISHALERERIVRIAMQGYTRVADATAFSDLYARYHDPRVLEEEGDWTKYDVARAEALLDEAGLRRGEDGIRRLPDGRPLKLDLNCVVGWSDWIIAAQIMVKNLQAVGIDSTLRTYEFGAYFNRLQTGDFDLSISWSDGGATPFVFYQRLMSKDTVRPVGQAAESNWHRFSSARADELLEAFAAASDPEEQQRLASELQREYVRHAPTLPLFPGPTWGQYNTKRIKGFPTKDNPYAPLAPYKSPGHLLTLVELEPVTKASSGQAQN